MNADTQLAHRFKQVRARHGFTQEWVEGQTAIKQETQSRWERLLENNKPVKMNARNRDAARRFVEVFGAEVAKADDLVVQRAKVIAADELDRLAGQLRAEAMSDSPPPTCRATSTDGGPPDEGPKTTPPPEELKG